MNGRENGFAIYKPTTDKKVVISNDRRSDAIVVYSGKLTDFGMSGNNLSDNVYNHSKHFDTDGYVDAAEYAMLKLDGLE